MPDEIEFFDHEPVHGSGGSAADPVPGPRRGSSRGGRVVLGAGAVALLVAGLVVRAATGSPSSSDSARAAQHDARSPAPVSATAAQRAGSLSTPADMFCPAPEGGGSVVPEGDATGAYSSTLRVRLGSGSGSSIVTCAVSDVAACPASGTACRITGEIPMAVVTAVRERFHAARYLGSQSVLLTDPPQLRSRRLQFAVPGRGSLQVLIQHGGDGAGASGNLDNGTNLIVRHVYTAPTGTTVIVQLTEPSGARPDDGTLAQLAADPRLLAIG